MSETPRTLGDVVMMHAKESDMCGTREGLNLLGLSHTTHHAAANMYLAALAIIKRQDTELTPALKDAERYRMKRKIDMRRMQSTPAYQGASESDKAMMLKAGLMSYDAAIDAAIAAETTKEKS